MWALLLLASLFHSAPIPADCKDKPNAVVHATLYYPGMYVPEGGGQLVTCSFGLTTPPSVTLISVFIEGRQIPLADKSKREPVHIDLDAPKPVNWIMTAEGKEKAIPADSLWPRVRIVYACGGEKKVMEQTGITSVEVVMGQ